MEFLGIIGTNILKAKPKKIALKKVLKNIGGIRVVGYQ
ncbi:putative uncharacterized protein [Helicobacter felis ATCC 49179]|uniref:Uncharacterized protein n=1 Tax=Helicobacter felis (strain ATCC 49179 / CCUG 28539 / NCTC 12436 / CS1) TaxID=936155 RepID=E7AB80_HELFC|nr:putative uncharacterized protein [Helicobacter felis ATCC 49179]